MRRSLALACILAACAGPGAGPGAGRPGCGSHRLTVANLSPVAAEQLYLGSGRPDGWGADLLGPGGLPANASTILLVPGGARAVRTVWTDGRAVELGSVDTCRISRLTLLDTALQAE